VRVLNKEDVTSPTIMTESVMLLCIIDEKEGGQRVAMANITSAFMQMDVDKAIHIGLTGPMAELLDKVDPKM
jgi:hypothetical protein